MRQSNQINWNVPIKTPDNDKIYESTPDLRINEEEPIVKDASTNP